MWPVTPEIDRSDDGQPGKPALPRALVRHVEFLNVARADQAGACPRCFAGPAKASVCLRE
jgi:hypothetical protein